MSKYIVLCYAIICAFALVAQDPIFFTTPQSDSLELPDHALIVEGSYLYDSDAIFNEMLFKLRQGGFIDREVRQRSLDAMQDHNRVGQELEIRARLWGCDTLFGKPHWQSMLSVSHHAMLGVRYTRDAFALTFFGNKQFEDKTASLDDSAYEQQVFQQISWGILDRRSLSWLQVSVVKGQQLEAIELDLASLYTAPDGRSLDAEILGAYHRSDTASANDLRAFNGIGGALSAQMNRPLHIGFLGDRRSWLRIELSEFGVISWNKNSLHQNQDTTFTYRGIEIQDVFDLTDVTLNENDLLDTLGLRYERGSYTRLMPFRIAVGLSSRHGHTWSSYLGVDQRYLPGYSPKGTLRVFHHFGNHGRLGAVVSYGGFGGLRAGMELECLIKKKIFLSASLPNLSGLAGDEGRGLAASVDLGWFF